MPLRKPVFESIVFTKRPDHVVPCRTFAAGMRRTSLKRTSLPVIAMMTLLFMAMGPMVSRMTCLSSGKTVVELGRMSDCCASECDKGATIDPVCCEFSSFEPGLVQYLTHAQLDLQVPPPLPLAFATHAPAARCSIPAERWDARPPPLLASERTARLCAFLI